ncbi:MAG: non-heme iron oxygenase ferredoxin subunit [candidate division Zixibacteria bacterium]|nr:non-heme iron oxygenase ferredoxin subunit [candidate division Zixibacteria bacterium]
MGQFIKAAEPGEVQPGKMKLVEVDRREIALCNVDGQFFAVDNICPHQGAPLCEGELDGNNLWCPWHGASFDVRNGAVLSPPAYTPIASFPVRVTAGGVEIEV